MPGCFTLDVLGLSYCHREECQESIQIFKPHIGLISLISLLSNYAKLRIIYHTTWRWVFQLFNMII